MENNSGCRKIDVGVVEMGGQYMAGGIGYEIVKWAATTLCGTVAISLSETSCHSAAG
jgi:hypothetical protein